MQGHEQGFTIIEVTIFLAISGLLLVGMFLGTGTLAARQRFTDSTDSLLGYFQSQYEEVVNGVNIRGSSISCDGATSTKAGKSQCLLLGKVLTLYSDSSVIKVTYVISTNDVSGVSGNEKAKLQAAGLQVITDGQTSYDVRWGATLPQTTRSNGSATGGVADRVRVNSVAFIRLPDSDRIIQLYYRNGNYGNPEGAVDQATFTNELQAALADDGAYSPAVDSTGSSLAVCVKNSNEALNPHSVIVFGRGQGAGTITTNYDPGALCPLN